MYYNCVLQLRTTTYYYVLLRTTTYYYVLLRTTTYYYVLLGGRRLQQRPR